MIRKYGTENAATYLEGRIEQLRSKIEEQEMYDTLEAQGEGGSMTRFTDINHLYAELTRCENKLQLLYRYANV